MANVPSHTSRVSLPARILRLHRSALAPNPTVRCVESAELVAMVDRVLGKTSVAESVAVVQIVALPIADTDSQSAQQEAFERLEILAANCREKVRAYDEVTIWNWSVVIIMWGVTGDGRIVHDVITRLLGSNLDEVGSPRAAVGAAIAQPGADPVEVVQETTKAVVEARSTNKPVVVVGSSPARNATFDRLAGLAVALTPVRDFKRPDVRVMLGRIMVDSAEGRRTNFFTHPGPSVVDRLLVAIEAVSTLASQADPGWEEVALEVPLYVLRASNTTPKVVESVMAEIAHPERLGLLLTGPGDSTTFDEVQPILEPIRAAGATVLRVWDYDRRRLETGARSGAGLVRIGLETTSEFIARESGGSALALGPIRLAKKMGAVALLDGGPHSAALTIAESAGARYVMGDAVGATQYLALRESPRKAA